MKVKLLLDAELAQYCRYLSRQQAPWQLEQKKPKKSNKDENNDFHLCKKHCGKCKWRNVILIIFRFALPPTSTPASTTARSPSSAASPRPWSSSKRNVTDRKSAPWWRHRKCSGPVPRLSAKTETRVRDTGSTSKWPTSVNQLR